MFRRELALIIHAKGDPYTAATTLNAINYGDQDQFALKTDDFLTLAEWWFDMEDSTQAEIYVNRVKHMIHHV